jgi:hypothetical protein
LVSIFVATTTTPWSTAELESVAVPRMEPVTSAFSLGASVRASKLQKRSEAIRPGVKCLFMGYLLAITHTLTYDEKDVNCAKLVQWPFWERGVRIISTRL